MLNNLDQLRAFVAAAECGSFSAGGRRLGRAQSVVSTHIAMLEADLGLELFARTGRHPALTEAGRALLAEAREVLLQAEQMEMLALALGENPEAELRLALDEGLPSKEMSMLCAKLAARFPQLTVQLLYGAPTEVMRWVENRDAQLGVAYEDPELRCEGVESRRLGQMEQVLVVSEHHPLAGLGRVSRRELARHRRIATRFALESSRMPPALSTSVWAVNSSYVAVDLALCGIGWAVVPMTVAHYNGIAEGKTDLPPGLVMLDYEDGFPALHIRIMWSRGRPFTLATSWVFEELRALLQGDRQR